MSPALDSQPVGATGRMINGKIDAECTAVTCSRRPQSKAFQVELNGIEEAVIRSNLMFIGTMPIFQSLVEQPLCGIIIPGCHRQNVSHVKL